VKQQLATETLRPGSGRLYRGYSRNLGEGDWAHNEMLDFGPEPPVGGPPLPGISVLTEPNVFPEPEPVAGWRQDMLHVYRTMMDAGQAVFAALARHLGLDEARIAQFFAASNSTLRFLDYHRRPEGLQVRADGINPDGRPSDPDQRPDLIAGQHTDATAISLLWQGEPGLQTQTRDGRWQDVPVVADCLSIHLGDIMHLFTEGRLEGTMHRVLDLGGTRRSAGFFFEPALAAPLTSLLPGKGDPAAETYGGYLLRRIRGYKGYAAVMDRRVAAERAAAAEAAAE
jgi:isopenicillin N synthase-like dioxygenase